MFFYALDLSDVGMELQMSDFVCKRAAVFGESGQVLRVPFGLGGVAFLCFGKLALLLHHLLGVLPLLVRFVFLFSSHIGALN